MSQFELTEDQIAIQAVALIIEAMADGCPATSAFIPIDQSSDENDCRTRFIAPMTPL